MACVAFGCKSHTSRKNEKNPNVTFHRFPVNHITRKIWVKAVRRVDWEPTKYSRLCSNHFTPECYIQGSKRKNLRSDAAPTIFESNPVHIISAFPNQSRENSFDFKSFVEIRAPSDSSDSEQSLDDVPKKKKVIAKEQIKSASHRLKLRNLQQKCRRMAKKIETLENIIKDLNDRALLRIKCVQVKSEIGGEN